jgi:hypothetical protein
MKLTNKAYDILKFIAQSFCRRRHTLSRWQAAGASRMEQIVGTIAAIDTSRALLGSHSHTTWRNENEIIAAGVRRSSSAGMRRKRVAQLDKKPFALETLALQQRTKPTAHHRERKLASSPDGFGFGRSGRRLAFGHEGMSWQST